VANIRVTNITPTTMGRQAAAAAGEAAPWIVRLARVGYAAKGVVYLVIGALAVMAAMGARGSTTDSRGALSVIGDRPFGRVLLLVIGLGLIGYTLYALIAAAMDAEDRGSDAKGIALRLGMAGRGLLYGGLGVSALLMSSGSGSGGGGGGADRWTGRLMSAPFGPWLVGGVGIAIAGYALYQFWRAAHKNLRKRLHLAEAGPGAAAWVLRLARFGIAARGVVFLLIGWFLVQAAWQHDASEAGGIADSLATLARQPYGPVLLGVVALGLMAYGVWQLANARYREMRVN
jgi:hypothetical protein